MDAWLAWYDSGKSDSKRWGAYEDSLMIASPREAASEIVYVVSSTWRERCAALCLAVALLGACERGRGVNERAPAMPRSTPVSASAPVPVASVLPPPPPLDPALAAKPPYAQPLADPGRTGLALRPLRLPLSRTIEVVLDLPSSGGDAPVRWLAAREKPPSIVATMWLDVRVVDIGQRPSVGSLRSLHHSTVTAVPGGWLGVIENLSVHVLPPDWIASGRDLYPGGAEPCRGELLALRWSSDAVTVLVQATYRPSRDTFLDGVVLCRLGMNAETRALEKTPVVLWHSEGRAAPSPFLPDGSVVVSRDDGLSVDHPELSRVVRPEVAQKLSEEGLLLLNPQGKPGRRIPGRFLLGRISASGDGALFAFERATTRDLLLVVIRGERQERVELGTTDEPLQPPVLLPGGRVIVVTASSVLSVEGKSVRWRWNVPLDPRADELRARPFASWERAPPSSKWGDAMSGSGLPLATGTLDGSVVVRSGRDVVALDPNGKPSFQLRVASLITTNPVLTPDGGICVGHWREQPSGNTLTCALPP